MGQVDIAFNGLVEDILANGKWQDPKGVRAVWDDGTPAPAKSVTDVQWKFDNSEALAPTTKVFYYRRAVEEILWIWQIKSNYIQSLRDLSGRDTTIWDSWMETDPESPWYGTIGPAYGFILRQRWHRWKASDVNFDQLNPNRLGEIDNNGYVLLDQVDNAIQTILKSPGSRRILTTLWVPSYLDQMKLTPCVWSTEWLVWDGKLNLTVNIRSNDICVGNPFNVFQYQVLQRMIAQVCNLPAGTITFNIVDAHIYNRQIELATQQILEPVHQAPELWINPDVKNFYEFKPSDVKLYHTASCTPKKYAYPVAK